LDDFNIIKKDFFHLILEDIFLDRLKSIVKEDNPHHPVHFVKEQKKDKK